ncbi:MAG: DAK2 domain-containing protein [Lawsonibacter sp.]
MNEIKSSDWTAILQSVAQVMTDNADHLCEMDARMGDGDLGLTMKKGYCALPEIYAGLEEADMGKRLSKSGMKMSSVVPSTMGTLMSSGWMEGGKRLVGKETVDAAGYAAFLRGFADGIVKRGKCAPRGPDGAGRRSACRGGGGEGRRCRAGLADTAKAALEGAKPGWRPPRT